MCVNPSVTVAHICIAPYRVHSVNSSQWEVELMRSVFHDNFTLNLAKLNLFGGRVNNNKALLHVIFYIRNHLIRKSASKSQKIKKKSKKLGRLRYKYP